MSADPRRVALWSLALLCAGAWAIAYAPRLMHPATEAPAAPKPMVMDLADADVRLAMSYLLQRSDNGLAGGWLGRTCDPRNDDASADRYVLTRNTSFVEPGFPDDPPKTSIAQPTRRYAFSLQDSAGWVSRWIWDGDMFMERPPKRGFRVLTAAEGTRLRSALARAGYQQMPIQGDLGACHAEITALESCVGGRFHAVLRMCYPDSQPVTALADELESILTRGRWHDVATAARNAR